MREGLRYTLALLVYIGIAMMTKHFLTWTWGPIYFVTVLEVLPRAYRVVRGWLAGVVRPEPEREPTEAGAR